jgi:hypothetical protein
METHPTFARAALGGCWHLAMTAMMYLVAHDGTAQDIAAMLGGQLVRRHDDAFRERLGDLSGDVRVRPVAWEAGSRR